MHRAITLALAGVLLGSVSASAHRAHARHAHAHRSAADAWSAATAAEKSALAIHPWDPDTFRHPEQYGEDGRKRTQGKSRTSRSQ
jgi:hypothetical protein